MPHPQGESKITSLEAPKPGDGEPLVIETEGGRYQVQWDNKVQWDNSAPATPYGQLVFFAQFLKAGGAPSDAPRPAQPPARTGTAPAKPPQRDPDLGVEPDDIPFQVQKLGYTHART